MRIPYNPSTIKTFESSRKAGFGKKPDLERGKVPEDWWYFPVVARLHSERTGYPTQKPEALLERIFPEESQAVTVSVGALPQQGIAEVIGLRDPGLAAERVTNQDVEMTCADPADGKIPDAEVVLAPIVNINVS